MSRKSGILLPVFSLPGDYGIGTLGKSAYDFADYLEQSGQHYWQILPLGHTENGSPYEVISAFAGNPYLIDLDMLIEDGLLNKQELRDKDFGSNEQGVDYKKLYKAKKDVLRRAFQRISTTLQDKVTAFREENILWIEDYALYNALNVHFGTSGWREWKQPLKLREEKTLTHYRQLLKDEMDYWYFVQYEFFKQWNELKKYVNNLGCEVIGDIPIYVSVNSVDVWVHSKLFKLDDQRNPIYVAGCPPDNYSEEGQYWGYPVYDWNENESSDFEWWIDRIRENYKLYDVIRLDHFIGFKRYWEIPGNDTTAKNGQWVEGPGIKFFNTLKQKLGDVSIVVEDLGDVGEDIIQFRKQVGYMGMKVLIFAFDSRVEVDYMPHNYGKDAFIYSTVHDTDTASGWMQSAATEDVKEAIQYLHLDEEEGYHWGLIRGSFSSVCDVAIVQMQDILGLGSEARMNVPPLLPNNWMWRMKQDAFTEILVTKLYEITKRYDRLRNNNLGTDTID